MVATAPAGAKTRRTGSGSHGRVNFSARGEGRDDSEYLDIERSKDYHNRALSSPRSDKGDVAIARRKSKAASIRSSVGPEVATAPQERRRERREASSKQSSKALRSRRSEAAPIASSRSKADAQNDISNLGREFELGLVCSDLRSQHSATITNIQSPYYTGEHSSANSAVDKITAPKQSDKSAVSDVNIHRSLSSVLAGGGRSRKSSGKVSTANTRSIRNNHSSKKERASISTSKRKKLQQKSEVEYWTGLSVRVAMAVMQANGSEKMAQKASSIILVEGRRQSGQERSIKMMRALSAKLSVAMLEAKADQRIILAVMNAVSEYDNNENAVKSAESMSFDDSSTIKTDPNVHVDLAEEIESVAPSAAPSVAPSAASSVASSVAPSLVPTIRSHRSKAVSTVRSNRSKAVSVNQSMASKRSKLQTIEMQILEKQMAIEEAELRNQEREREFNERIAAMKAATNERLAALDATKDSLLEEEESTLAYQQVILADEWQRTRSDIQQEDNGNEKVNAGNEKINAFQSGLDDFVMGFNQQLNQQMTALDIAAKEGLASLDATKTSLLEKSGLTQVDRRVDATAENSRSANKENTGTGAVSAIQSGIGGFVLGINQQLAALSAAAKEKLAGLDATKTSLLENAGSTKGDRKDVTGDESRNINEDVKQEDNGSALQMFKSRLLHSFDCGDGPKVNSSSSSGKGDDLALWEI